MDRRDFLKLCGAGTLITAVPFTLDVEAAGWHLTRPLLKFDYTGTYGDYVTITDELTQGTIDEAVKVLADQASKFIPRGQWIDIIIKDAADASDAARRSRDPLDTVSTVGWKWPGSGAVRDDKFFVGSVRL